jgi:heme A synthase
MEKQANTSTHQGGWFTRFAWLFVLYLIGVIMFGAWVRITHSGAGCGSHWPTCHGDIIPIAPSVETMIEYTHRLTSGLCGIFGLILLGWAWAKYRASRVFYGMLVTLLFIILEGAIGAGLVLKELVADDSSAARAIVISLHLVNTLMLTGAASLTAWWSVGNERPRLRGGHAIKWLVGAGMVALVFTSMSGAVTALGDTLFPVTPTDGGGLFAHVKDDLSATNHFLVRLRAVHPVLAILTAAFNLWLANHVIGAEALGKGAKRWAILLASMVGVEVLLGLLNVMLHAPGWAQLSHLFTAQVIWIAVLLMGASALNHTSRSSSGTSSTAR